MACSTNEYYAYYNVYPVRNIVDISTKFDQFGSIWLVVRNVRIQRRWLWYFADTPGLSISTSLPRSILIRYVLLQDIVRENRVFG